MKTTGFKRAAYVRPPVSLPRPVREVAPTVITAGLGLAQPKTVQQRNPHLLAMARGMPCLLRVPDVCRGDGVETTVAAHSNLAIHGKAGARKANDQFHAHGCAACHRWLDQGPAPRAEKTRAFMAGHVRQVEHWRLIVADPCAKPADKKSAQWALNLLNAAFI